MTTINATSRLTFVENLRAAALPLTLAALSVVSLGYPLTTPIIGAAGAGSAYVCVRKTGASFARFALALCLVVLLLSIVVDFGLLGANTVSVGPTGGGRTPS